MIFIKFVQYRAPSLNVTMEKN